MVERQRFSVCGEENEEVVIAFPAAFHWAPLRLFFSYAIRALQMVNMNHTPP